MKKQGEALRAFREEKLTIRKVEAGTMVEEQLQLDDIIETRETQQITGQVQESPNSRKPKTPKMPTRGVQREEYEDFPKPGDTFVGNSWEIIKKIGEGGYGCVYLVKNLKNGTAEVMKVEKQRATRPLLKMETLILKRLQGSGCAANFLGCGVTTNGLKYLVMELLGTNIGTLRRQAWPEGLGISISIEIVHQMLSAIRALHQIGFIHRDIKLSNFAMGHNPPKDKKVHIFDFGLCRQFCNFDGYIRKPRYPAGFRGTLKYCSANALMKQEMDRRDDLINLTYLMSELLVGNLPWSRMTNRREIKETKLSVRKQQLFRGCPPELLLFYDHIWSLQYGDTPNYDYLDSLLYDVFRRK